MKRARSRAGRRKPGFYVLQVEPENRERLEELARRGLFGPTIEAVIDELVRSGLRSLELEGWCGTNKRAGMIPGICRGCGCTELDACPGGCSWVEPDLCSACVTLGAPPATKTKRPPGRKNRQSQQR